MFIFIFPVVYLSAGGLFLIVGFVSLLRIHNNIKKQDKQTKKLEKLIVKVTVWLYNRYLDLYLTDYILLLVLEKVYFFSFKLLIQIFIFSLLYMIPAAIRIGCYFYESEFRNQWDQYSNCGGSCGSPFTTTAFYSVLVRISMELIVGCTSFIWIVRWELPNLLYTTQIFRVFILLYQSMN